MDGSSLKTPTPLVEPLTHREGEVLNWLATDLSNREISERLVLAPSSVKWYIKQIYAKLVVTNREQAIAKAKELGLLKNKSPDQLQKIPSLNISASPQFPPFLKENIKIKRPVFVTREGELERLSKYLDTALTGCGQIVFVKGDPGQGKTALIQEFAWRSQEIHPDLIVTSGNCNAYTGSGDPYLPFREVLDLLAGDVQARWEARAISQEQARRLWQNIPLFAHTLVDSGPDLVNLFIPGAPLLKRLGTFGPQMKGREWLERLEALTERKRNTPESSSFQQAALFEQYTRVIRGISRQYPLLLILDDLQWMDGGSINLLFHLARRVEGSRVMIVGALRPNEVALSRGSEKHPLMPVIYELKRQFGDIEIDLGQTEGRKFVDDFLDSELNHFDDEFRRTLFKQMGGHPLATIELMRSLQECSGIIQDGKGYWIAGPNLDWETLPARVDAMIAERISRLSNADQTILRVAAVEGESFTAEVIARVLAVDEQQIVNCLSGDLDKTHCLIRAQDIHHLNGQTLSVYRFRHILFQRYVYNSLDAVERSRLHQSVGSALQKLYGESNQEIALQLALHFKKAGVSIKAANYLNRAGDWASDMIAPEEAIVHYGEAMQAYQNALGNQWDPLQRAELEQKIGDVLTRKGEYHRATEHLKEALSVIGYPFPVSKLKVRISILWELLRQISHRLLPGLLVKPARQDIDPLMQVRVSIYNSIGWIVFQIAPDELLLVTLKALNISERCGYSEGVLIGSTALGVMLDFFGLFQPAETYHQKAVKIAGKIQKNTAMGMAYLGMGTHKECMGELEMAIRYQQDAALAWQKAGDYHKQAFMEHMQADGMSYLANFDESLKISKKLVDWGIKSADPQIQCWGLSAQGLTLKRCGRLDESVTVLKEAIRLAEMIPDYGNYIEATGELGSCYAAQGKLDEAMSALKEGQRVYGEQGISWGNDISVFNGLADYYLKKVEQSDNANKHFWMKQAKRACDDALRRTRTFRPAMVEALRFQGAHEWLNGNKTNAQKWWLRSVNLAQEMRLPYDLALTYLEIGKRTGDKYSLERAESILKEINMDLDLICDQRAKQSN